MTNYLPAMVIKDSKIIIVIAGATLLLLHCRRISELCPKEGYEYVNTTLRSWYSPTIDSIPLGQSITLVASAPRSFIDENTGVAVKNTCPIINGPLGIVMIYPSYQAAADSFEVTAQTGKVIKDTANFSEGILKGFRTIEWDGSFVDSFKIEIKVRTLAKGIYGVALGQQGYKDIDCARYKYFPRVGNSDQHLDFWLAALGNVSDNVRYYTYCFKVY